MENYFWNTNEKPAKKMVYVLVIYGIINNKRRVKFAKEMQGYGMRVQKSAFEAMINDALYNQLLREIPHLIDIKEDTVRVYKIRGSGEVQLFGQSNRITYEETFII